MSTETSPSTPPTHAAASRSAWRSTIGAIALDAAPPLAIFAMLRALGVPDVLAYTAGAVVPLGRLIADRWRGRPFNVISGLIAVCLVVSVVLALTTGDARAVIARGGVIYLALTVAAAASVPTRNPLMLLLSRYFARRTRPDAVAQLDELYHRTPVLRAMRRVTAVWALAFGVSGLACVVCAYTLPIAVAAVVTSLLEPAIAMVLAAGTGRYLRRSAATLATPPVAPEDLDNDGSHVVVPVTDGGSPTVPEDRSPATARPARHPSAS